MSGQQDIQTSSVLFHTLDSRMSSDQRPVHHTPAPGRKVVRNFMQIIVSVCVCVFVCWINFNPGMDK